MLNRGLLTPTERVEAAIAAYENGEAPLNSVEGFVREIIGWREFITGVYWHRGPEYKMVNALGAERPLPAWFYTAETPMNVLGMSLYADGGYMARKPYEQLLRNRFDPDQKTGWTRARPTTCIGTSSADTRSGSGRIRGCARSLAVG